MYIFILIFLSLYFLFYYNLDNIYLHFLKGFKIELQNLSEDIKLIIECCKTEKNYTLIENIVPQIKDWDKFINLSYSHGVFPLVYHTLKEFQDQTSIQVLAKLKSINLDIAKQNMLMTSELLKVMKLLEENGIKAIAFKGPVLSQMAYGDITLRQYVDLDILIDEIDLERTSELLQKNNYKELYDLQDYQKENLKNLVHDRSFINKTNGINIELHWTLSSSEFFIDLEGLNYLENVEKSNLNTQEINVLSLEILFIYLCIHGNKHMWERIEWLVDLVLLIKKENIDLEKVLNLSKKIDAERVVLSSILICEKIFSINFHLNIHDNTSLQKVVVKYLTKLYNDYSNPNKSKHTKQVSYIQWYMLKSFKNRIKYIKALLTPTENDYESLKLSKSFSFFLLFG